MSLDEGRLVLRNLDARVKMFISANILDWAKQSILPQVIIMAQAANLPEKFIQGIDVEQSGPFQITFFNDWSGKWDEPLAKWFNYGTKRNYVIENIVKHPKGGYRTGHSHEKIDHPTTRTQHPKVLHWKKNGVSHFARRVIHPGFPKTEAIERGVELGLPIWTKRIQEETKRYILAHRE